MIENNQYKPGDIVFVDHLKRYVVLLHSEHHFSSDVKDRIWSCCESERRLRIHDSLFVSISKSRVSQ